MNTPANSLNLRTVAFKGSWTLYLVQWRSTRKKSFAQVWYQRAFMLIRDNMFDEFTLLDEISKINMTPALTRLSSVSRRINAHLSTYGWRLDMSVHPKPRTLRNFSAHTQFYRCVRHRKAATHNWRIQVSGALGKHNNKQIDCLCDETWNCYRLLLLQHLVRKNLKPKRKHL
jgi:hypothetical protein